MGKRNVAVYNQGGVELLGYVRLRNAIRNIVNEKYRILREAPGGVHFGDIPQPEAVELVRWRYAKEKYEAKGEVPFSKRAVLRRDNYVCCYCGGYGDTVDHVLPKWEGNAASWNNSVAACFPCNNKKGGRSPEQAGMKMRYRPRTPLLSEAFRLTKAGRTPDDVDRGHR